MKTLACLFLLILSTLCTAETIAQILDTAKTTQTLNKLTIIANGKTFLGNFGDKYNIDSIFNTYGLHGSSIALDSIWNDIGLYGGKIALNSPFNDITRTPPILYYNGASVCYLTANTTLAPAMTVEGIIEYLAR